MRLAASAGPQLTSLNSSWPGVACEQPSRQAACPAGCNCPALAVTRLAALPGLAWREAGAGFRRRYNLSRRCWGPVEVTWRVVCRPEGSKRHRAHTGCMQWQDTASGAGFQGSIKASRAQLTAAIRVLHPTWTSHPATATPQAAALGDHSSREKGSANGTTPGPAGEKGSPCCAFSQLPQHSTARKNEHALAWRFGKAAGSQGGSVPVSRFDFSTR